MQHIETAQRTTEPLQSQHTPLIVKPTLVNLINRHHLSMIRLSKASQVPPAIVQAMIRNEPVLPIVAERILATISQLSGARYTLKDVEIAVHTYRSYQ